jgi:ADP-heptose:LPS heptosyltransferase
MKKQNKSKGFRYLLSRMLSAQAAIGLIRLRYKRNLLSSIVEFPLDPGRFKRILVILPEDPLEALHQTSTVLSLGQLFGSAELALLCTDAVADFFRLVPGITSINNYPVDDRFIFSKSTAMLCNALAHEAFDAAILLEKQPHPALLKVLAACKAPCRIGFYDSAEFPFVNIRIRPSGRMPYLSDFNSVLPRTIGGPVPKPLKWTVPKESLQEIRHLLKEHSINPELPLIGLDAGLFHRQFGPAWLETFLAHLSQIGTFSLFCAADPDSDPDTLLWFKQRGVGIIPPLSTARSAALIQLASLQITGNTVNYQLGFLLGRPVVGIFSRSELQTYFKPALNCRAVSYETSPDTQTISAVAAYLSEFGLTGTSGNQPAGQTG